MTVTDNDGFFEDLANTKPFLKAAWEGFAGSGKTYSMAQVALGLHERIGSTKPIALQDTEEAGKFLLPFFRQAGVKVLHKRSKSLADTREIMARGRDGVFDIFLIDTVSHIWEQFIEDYKRKLNRKSLQFEDWGVIKPLWKSEFSDPFVRDPYHAMFTGRAAYEYDNEKDDRGKRQIFKSGIKMKVEGETAYEPDILVLMERFEEVLDRDKQVWREATVIKDRSTLVDGKTFRNPTYQDFAPAVDFILDEGIYRPAGPEKPTADLITTEENWHREKQDRTILSEEIAEDLKLCYPGQTEEEKKGRSDLREQFFGTRSWTKISENTKSRTLRDGRANLRRWMADRGIIPKTEIDPMPDFPISSQFPDEHREAMGPDADRNQAR